jgi:hypothetical protein
MKEMDWIEERLKKRKSSVRHLRIMIKNTKHDKGNSALKKNRDGMIKILAQKYDVNSPESIFCWLEDLCRHLLTTKILLKKAKRGLREKSRTASAYKYTENLLKKLIEDSRKLKKTI